MDKYQTRHITQLFEISHQTVKDWTEAFADFLSPTATPGKGRARHFTEDDLRVFTLVSEIKRSGGTFEDVRAALAAGQRGTLATDLDQQLMLPTDLSITRMKKALTDAREEAQMIRDELMQVKGENRLLREQLEAREQSIRELYRQMARLEAGQGDAPKDKPSAGE
ncbi:MAG: hypothetical protein CMJ42_18405 [Phyllobacteriaceae bacterium]|nr:hypothetical protein [Phyllobacteriaceae bacterium]